MDGDFRIGDWLVQPQVGTITRGEQTISLEPKVMDVLVFLVQHPDEVLPKERIIRAIWPDTFVTDEVLTNAISEIRKSFGDDARNPEIIQTLPRRGYRLIAPVSSLPASIDNGTAKIKKILRGSGDVSWWKHPAWITIGGLLLTFSIVLLIWQLLPKVTEETIDSIAILPFQNETGEAEANYLCSGIPWSISSRLSSLRSLRVIPTANLARFRSIETDPRSAADQLEVRAILQGWLTLIGEELSIRVELSDGSQNPSSGENDTTARIPKYWISKRR